MPSITRSALPLASLTAVGMLATDLYLPALPSLASQLSATLTQSQATMAVFMAALAASQLLWGWATDKFGATRILLLGMLLLGGGSLLCALAPEIGSLLLGRLIQGLGAGASTVVVPVLLRQRFAEADAVKAMALVGMAESVIPALGPVAGAVLVSYADWRWAFWIIVALTLLQAPFLSGIVAAGSKVAPAAAPSNYLTVLRNRAFTRYSVSYAFMFGALLMFVSSAPELVTDWLKLPISGFAILQIGGVLAFMAGATLSGKLVQQQGIARLNLAGAWIQGSACVIFLLLAWLDWRSLPAMILAWSIFCLALGLRGPVTMTAALSAAHAFAGKASGLLMFMAFAMSAAATMLVALLLKQGLLPVAVCLAGMVLASSILIARPTE